MTKPFAAFLPRKPPISPAAAHSKAAKQLFNEALTLYLSAMRRQNLLTRADKETLLLAVHGLTTLGSYPLARVLIRLTFSELTAEEMLEWIERARQQQRSVDCEVPF